MSGDATYSRSGGRRSVITRVCVFCGSSAGEDSRYLDSAERFGRVLAREGVELVYGGSRVGMMGRLAAATLQAGGRVIGVIPGAIMNRELAHQALTELRVVKSMHERKSEMADLSAAFVALPGGLGTWRPSASCSPRASPASTRSRARSWTRTATSNAWCASSTT